MPEKSEVDKANPVEIARNTKGTPTAKLIAILIANGITDTKTLSEITGLKPRAIQCARSAAQCAQLNAHAQHNAPDAQQVAPSAAQCAEPAPVLTRGDNTTRATKELPSEVVISSTVTPLAPHDVCDAPQVAPKTVVQSPIENKPSRQRGTRLPEAWELPADWRMWARTNFPASTDPQIDDQAAQFRDYWIAKPGAQASKLNWEATWRNWCRRGLSAAGMVRKPQHTGVYGEPSAKRSTVVPFRPTDTSGRPIPTISEALAQLAAEEATYAAG